MRNSAIGEKVLVLGCCGSGKSFFATRLARKTGLPLTHLDNVYWKPDGTHLAPGEFDRALEELLTQDLWILDGDFSRTYERRLVASDTAIFLDYDEETCLAGVSARAGKKRADLPWVEEGPSPELVDHIRNYRNETRPKLVALLSACGDKNVIVFKSRAEADAWLARL